MKIKGGDREKENGGGKSDRYEASYIGIEKV
jgi:hypothetical protein